MLSLIALIAVIASSRMVKRAQLWLSDPVIGRRRFAGLTGALGAITVVSAAICAALPAVKLRLLYGEPLSAFFQLVPASRLLNYDNARIAAVIEDRDARSNYKKPAQFQRKHAWSRRDTCATALL